MRCIVRIVKFWPIIINLAILLIIGCYHFNISISDFMYPIFGHALLIDICFLIMSKALKFCFWHRLLILNLIATIVLEWISVNIYSLSSVFYIRILFTLSCSTLLIATILYSKYGWFKQHAKITSS